MDSAFPLGMPETFWRHRNDAAIEQLVAPGLFESLVLLGRDESLERIATLGRRFAVEG